MAITNQSTEKYTPKVEDFEVTVTRPDPEAPFSNAEEDMVIFIDTPPGFTGKLRIYLNDSALYQANPEKHEAIAWTPTDGFYIVNKP